MYHTRELRWGVLVFALVALVLWLVFAIYAPAALPSEGAPCLEVPVVSLDVESSTLCGKDFSDCFLYNGEIAAMDVGSKTIYIPQAISEETTSDQLKGTLTLSVSNCRMYFLQDPAFDDLAQAVSQGHSFPLAVACGKHYHIYSVVFTTLPVLRMDSQTKQEGEETDAPEIFGQMCLWDTETGEPVSSELFFHARGGTTMGMEKRSWKLSLKTSSMKNNHLSFLGLQKDDDWILNAMSMDDSKIKEMFLTNVWNSITADSPWNYPMSSQRYVELVLDGSYFGVYLLQRRFDQKFLGLSDEDILLKGIGTWTITVPQDAYRIQCSPLSEAETYALVEGLYYREDVSILDLNNYLDISILLQLGSLDDNAGYKNIFYCLKKEETGYALSMIPWDVDMGLGVCWVVDHICYDYEYALSKEAKRQEYAQMLALYPDLEKRIQERWHELRKDVLSTQNLLGQMERITQQLNQSGAFVRDTQRWGLCYGGPDTQEAAVRFLEERLILLDGLYE